MKKLLFIFPLFLSIHCYSQNFYSRSGNNIALDNGHISKLLVFKEGNFFSTVLKSTIDTNNFIRKSNEFSFLLNDKKLSGNSNWNLTGVLPISDDAEGKGVKVILQNTESSKINLEINYLLYPDLPLIRKWIKFTNKGKTDLKLEALNVDDMHTTFDQVHSVVYHNYARMKHLGRFVGSWDDPVVVVHNTTNRRGIALGNEAIGVLKRTAFHTTQNNVEIGLTTVEEDFPFRKWLKPGESWESPKTFICLYNNRDDGFQVVNHEVNHFIVKHMRPRIVTLKEKPLFVYNTWNPFRTFVNDTLVKDVADAAAASGIEEFIIDDGWQINYQGETSDKGWGGNYGDWLVDENKFQGGLKPTFDYIKNLGMKPGLWMSLGSATKDSRVFREHPEWFIKNAKGKPGNIHYESDTDAGFYTASFGTEWKQYIKERILRLVDEYGLAYTKLDFAIVTSAYINNDSISGSYATDQPYYRDHNESFIVFYERLLELFDELHEEAPQLFIDCTFETAGKLQLMDYAIAQHAEGNWLSNFEEASPLGPLRVRQMAWWRSPALPAGSLVIGNTPMNDPNFEFGLKSTIGTLPIVLGDPRKMSSEKQKLINNWSKWMREMQEKYDYMSYRKDLPGFGEPREGAWDGWQRLNFQTNEGGIFGVFRQGAKEETRTVFLFDLEPTKEYTIRLAPYNKEIFTATGRELMENGFLVKIEKEYDGNIYEVGIN